MRRSTRLAAVRLAPAVVASLLLAACGGDGGTAPPVVDRVEVTPATATLEEVGATVALTARALDADGEVVSGATFTWSSSAEDVATVSTSGLVTAVEDGTATVTATADGVSGQAVISVTLGLRLVSPALPAGRQDIAYDVGLEATGGRPPYAFSLVDGELPQGLTLGTAGRLQGTPASQGTATFTVEVEDADGTTARREASLTVCAAPLPMARGEVRTLSTSDPGQCGIFLLSGETGDRYRVALLRTDLSGASSDVRTGVLEVRGAGVAAATAPPRRAAAFAGPEARLRPRVPRGGMGRAEATRRFHTELREREQRELASLGVAALPDRRAAAVAPFAQAALPDRLTFRTSTTCSSQGTLSTGIKIRESAVLAIYQEEGQNGSNPVTQAQAQALLDFYDDHGRETIEGYFGGVPDVNQDGKVVVFVSPVVDENINPVAAFVWSGDFFPQGDCAGSNEREVIYMSRAILDGAGDDEESSQALGTLVHEMKHVSSLYQRVQRWREVQNEQGQIPFHPVWLEEGVAEIAAEAASRLAWSRTGGAPVTARIDEDVWREVLGDRNSANDVELGILLKLFRTQEYLASQPNGLVEMPTGARQLASVYGSGWLFARWLGDAFGGAGTGVQAEAGFWAGLNTFTASSGISGLEVATGRSWVQLLEGWAAAVMASETPATVADGYTTYAFPSAIELWCFAVNSQTEDPENPDSCGDPGNPSGAFPWPVTLQPATLDPARTLATRTYTGPLGPAGIRVHEFVSDGTGAGAELRGDVDGGGRLVVVRIE